MIIVFLFQTFQFPTLPSWPSWSWLWPCDLLWLMNWVDKDRSLWQGHHTIGYLSLSVCLAVLQVAASLKLGWFVFTELSSLSWLTHSRFWGSVVQQKFKYQYWDGKLNSSFPLLNWCLHETTDPKETSGPKQSSWLISGFLPFPCSPQATYQFPDECLLNTFPRSHISLSICF